MSRIMIGAGALRGLQLNNRDFVKFQLRNYTKARSEMEERKKTGNLHLSYSKLKELRYEEGRKLLRRKTDKTMVEEFKKATEMSIIENSANENQMLEFFDLFNVLSFGGFDYYHITPIGEMIEDGESIVGVGSTDLVLVNSEHLSKLKQVIDCVPSLKFMSYMDENNNRSYSVWNVNTNNRIDFLTFRRYQKGIEIVSEDSEDFENPMVLYANEGVHNEIPYRSISSTGNENSKLETIYVKKLVKQKEA